MQKQVLRKHCANTQHVSGKIRYAQLSYSVTVSQTLWLAINIFRGVSVCRPVQLEATSSTIGKDQ